jgi:hypothetical protein
MPTLLSKSMLTPQLSNRQLSMTHFENKLRWWHWFAISLFIIWLSFSLAAFYVAQKPFDVSMVTNFARQISSWQSFTFSVKALINALLDVGTAVFIAYVSLGIGLWLWRILGPKNASPLDIFLFSEGIGIGLLGLFILFLGLIGWLNTTLLWGLMIGLSLLALPVVFTFAKSITIKRPSGLVTIYLFLMMGSAFTIALLPPTSWDSLSYHLFGPRVYLEAGRIFPGLDVYSLNNPFLLEMVFMLSMALRSDIAAQLIHFIFLFLLSGMVYSITVNGLNLTQGWTAVLLLFTIPMVLLLAPWAYNDLALAFVTLAALYAFVVWQSTDNICWLVLSGFFAGFSMGFKYTSFIVPLIIGLLILWKSYQQPKLLLRYWFIFGGIAFLVSFVWYAKNLAFTGNPFYPYVFNNGLYWDEYRANAHGGTGTGLGFNVIALLQTPYLITLGVNDASGDGFTGPLFLAFLPLIILYGITRLRHRTPFMFQVLLIYIAAHYAVWLLGVIYSDNLFQGRLLLPALAAMCPIIAWIIEDIKTLNHPQFSLHRFIHLVLVFVLFLGLISQLSQWITYNPLSYILGNQTREEYLEYTLGTLYVASSALEDKLSSDAVVQYLWEPRNYYCEIECRGDTTLDKYAHLEYLYEDPEKIAQAFNKEGVTHLLIFELGRNFLIEDESPWTSPANLENYQLFIEKHTTPIVNWRDQYVLYELVP